MKSWGRWWVVVVPRGHIVRDLSQRLQVAAYDGVDEDAGVFLGITLGGKSGHHVHLAEGAHVNAAVPDHHLAALHEMLVRLRLVEAPHHRPHRLHGGLDGLDHHGAALVGPHHVRVEANRGVRNRRESELRGGEGDDETAATGRLFGAVEAVGDGGFCVGEGVESFKMSRRRHFLVVYVCKKKEGREIWEW
ncbi:hypothetical protein G2W53_030488 [Senna tora]|uniref:Uncharacterized protein n=1 Tax=Senna tora TaxID=362788 RepID=A0A834T6H1_9FABA|nr:hypothetical protein G2W53_030488 [Senna tora]